MTQTDERRLRDAIDAAAADMSAPPELLDRFRRLGARRRRARYATGALAVVAVVAGATVAISVAHRAEGPARDRVLTNPDASHPAGAATVVAYAAAHHGTHPAGPFSGPGGTYAAYAAGLEVAPLTPDGRSWAPDGPSIALPSGTTPIRSIAQGPAAGQSSPSLLVQWTGGDVTTEAVVLVRLDGKWQAARFGACTDAVCGPGTLVYDSTVTAGVLRSTVRVCKPDCATGDQYVVTWKWQASSQTFVEARQRLAG